MAVDRVSNNELLNIVKALPPGCWNSLEVYTCNGHIPFVKDIMLFTCYGSLRFLKIEIVTCKVEEEWAAVLSLQEALVVQGIRIKCNTF